MISLERYNKQKHKYIHSVRRCNGLGYVVRGCTGKVYYMMYPLREVVKMYNAAAAQSIAAEKISKRG